MTKQKLRIGLLVNDYSIPAWNYKIIENINNSDHSEVVLVVKKKSKSQGSQSRLKTLWENRNKLAFILYAKIEKKLFKLNPNAFASKKLKDLVDCPEIVVTPKETKFSDRIVDEDIALIKSHDIDIFIRFGFRILRGGILSSAKYGIWSYHHGNNDVNRGGPAGVWQVLENWEETGVILQVLNEDLDGGLVIYRSSSSTDYISVNRNKNNYYWKAISFMTRRLKELHDMGAEDFFTKYKEKNTHPDFYYNRLYRTPNNTQLLKGVLSNYWRSIRVRIRNFFILDQWILLFKLEKKEGISQSFFRFKRITPPKDRFWADPFVLKRDDTYYIFIEELIYKENRGKISVIEMDEKGNHSKPEVVLETPYHLSYPHLIEDDGELYMLPETKGNNTIELYKCLDFPKTWKLEKIIFDNIAAVDSTIFKHDNKYWLFTNIRENKGASAYDELFLFYSDNLLADNWTPHPLNPIVSDVKTARPAGDIFMHNNRMYRPAQNCAKHYGYGMQIREIITLTEDDYKEEQVQSIYPNWADDLVSTHTLNSSGKLTVIDALVSRHKLF